MELIHLALVWDKTASGTVRSMKRVEAALLLAVVWDETASGTMRSNTEVLLLSVPEAVSSLTKVRSRSAV